MARSLAGLTPRWFGIFCLVLVPFALSRPNVYSAVLRDPAVTAVAGAALVAYALTFAKFAPVLLAVVAAANLAPRRLSMRAVWVVVALIGGSLTGTALSLILMVLRGEKSRALDVLTQGSTIENVARFAGLALGDVATCAVAVIFVYYLRRSAADAVKLRSEEQHRAQTERENAEARLALMQAQIEPHFLFNSLAIIRRLYETDPQRGQAMLQQLSQYLTASLPALRESRSTLGRELALAVAYLNVQKIRMGARLAFEVDVPQHLLEAPVPPMMLATLAENAIIHGVGPLPEGGKVTIKARHSDDRLSIEVSDNGRGLQDTWGVGVGLANIRARLASEFGARAAFSLRPLGERGVAASLDLPAHAIAAAA